MIHDKENQLADTQTFTSSAASEHIIDLVADRNFGIGVPFSVLFLAKSIAVVGGSETYNLVVQTSVDEAFSSPIEIARRNLTNAEAALELIPGIAGLVLAIAADERCDQFLRAFVETSGSGPDVDLTIQLQPTDGIPAEVRGGYANNSVIT